MYDYEEEGMVIPLLVVLKLRIRLRCSTTLS